MTIRRELKPAGRPKTAAVIRSSTDKTIEKREVFFTVCRSLNYSDRLALANGLGVAYFTVQRWSYGANMPDEQTRDDIVDWYNNGKPVTKILQCESLSGSL